MELSALGQCQQICSYSAHQWHAWPFCSLFGHAPRVTWRHTHTMKDDPIEAIREVRRKISESVGHDPFKLVELYQRLQERHRDRLISTASQRRATNEVE